MESNQFEVEPPPTLHQRRTKHQTYATVAITWGYLMYGASIGFNAPAIHSLMQGNATDLYGNNLSLTFQQASWMSAILSLGSFCGYLACVSLMGTFGRKLLVWCTTACYLIGHMAVFLASNSTHLYFSRFVVGLGVGGTIGVCGLYAYEMTSRDMRGLLCCSIQLPVAFGVLFSYVIGKFVTWNVLAAINASLLIPYWLLIKTTPESPYFLVGRGKEYSASESVKWLHGRNDNVVDLELLQIKQENKMNEMQKHSPTAVLMSHHWKPFSLCLVLAALLQLSGYNIFIYYSVIIFDIISPDVLHPYDPSIIAVFCMLLSYVFVLTVSYRLKRRHLLLISMIGMAGLHFLLGTCWAYNEADIRPYLHLYQANKQMSNQSTTLSTEDVQNATAAPIEANSTFDIVEGFSNNDSNPAVKFQVLSIATVAAFLCLSNIGWVSLNQVLCAELLPREIHRSANILIVSFSFLSAFISIKMFVDLVESLDAGHTFYLFGSICIFAALFTLIFVPETSQN